MNKKESIIKESLTNEVKTFLIDTLLSYKPKLDTIIVKCVPQEKRLCREVCVNQLNEPIVCDFITIPQEYESLCPIKRPRCDKEEIIKYSEKIVSKKLIVIENDFCFTEVRNCQRSSQQQDVTDNEYETIFSPSEIIEKKEKRMVSKIQLFLNKNPENLHNFSLCIGDLIPIQNKKTQQINETSFESFLEYLQVCSSKLLEV